MNGKDALSQVIKEFKIVAKDLAAKAGTHPAQLSRYRGPNGSDIYAESLLDIIRALTPAQQVRFLMLIAHEDLEQQSQRIKREFLESLAKELGVKLEIPSSEMALPRKRIICVDDKEADLDTLVVSLRTEGYDCFRARGADQAIAIVTENPGIELVISDYRMPKKDGIALAKEIETNFGLRIGVILVSGYMDRGVVQKAALTSHNYIDFLDKPFTDDELREAIKNGLDRSPARIPIAAA